MEIVFLIYQQQKNRESFIQFPCLTFTDLTMDGLVLRLTVNLVLFRHSQKG